MATEISDGGATPHATDYSDLLAKLKTFALANGWTSLEDTADKLVLQGEGAGTDEIIVAFQKYSYGWNINAYTGYTAGLTFHNQPGAAPSGASSGSNPAAPSIPLWNSTIPYWFIVNTRRIIVVAKVSTTFQMCYAGWMLPYASPGQYPYPMFVGGSCGGQGGAYTGITALNSAFWRGWSESGFGAGAPSVGWLPGGSRLAEPNAYYPSANLSDDRFRGVHPYNTLDHAFAGSGNDISYITAALDGDNVLYPVSWAIDRTQQGIIGELDGLYFPAGGGTSEDVITVGADDYLIVQNVFRTAATDIVAVKLV